MDHEELHVHPAAQRAPARPEAPVPERRPEVAAVLRLQRAAGNASTAQLLADDQERSPVLDVVGKGGGAPLDGGVRGEMEAALGTDFSGVRVHTGGDASASARAVQARAYTVGTDVVFDSGEYDPGSEAGRRTLAHELTHVVQQSEGEVAGTDTGNGVKVSDPSDEFERAAEASADAVIGGAASTPAPAAAPPGVQREAEPEEEEELQMLQREVAPEEEELQMLQREAAPEEEELQMLQREAAPEEEELAM